MNYEITLFLRCIVLLIAGMVVLACSLPWLWTEGSLAYKVASRVAAAAVGCMLAVALFMVGRLFWLLWTAAGAP